MAAPRRGLPLCASGSSELFLFYLLPREEGLVNSCFQMGKLGSEEAPSVLLKVSQLGSH